MIRMDEESAIGTLGNGLGGGPLGAGRGNQPPRGGAGFGTGGGDFLHGVDRVCDLHGVWEPGEWGLDADRDPGAGCDLLQHPGGEGVGGVCAESQRAMT